MGQVPSMWTKFCSKSEEIPSHIFTIYYTVFCIKYSLEFCFDTTLCASLNKVIRRNLSNICDGFFFEKVPSYMLTVT